MDQFRDYLLESRIQDFGISFPIQMIINTAIMWWVVNHLEEVGEKFTVKRCALGALLLYAVSAGAIALCLFPSALVLIGAVAVWLVGSLTVIRIVFQLVRGAGWILFYYLLVLAGVHILVGYILH